MSVDRNLFPSATPVVGVDGPVVYPESDGLPMAENTRQWDLIVLIVNGLRLQFANDPNVFVAGDLFWYPIEGDPNTRVAPDALVAFGRPPRHRGSYLQWLEGNVSPQVVFEVLSPSNRTGEMLAKRHFYERHGVEEYYVLDPRDGSMEGWRRLAGRFQPITDMQGWTSPLLQIRFESDPADEDAPIRLYHSNGARFATAFEMDAAKQKAEQEQQKAEQRAARLAERLRRLGLDPDLDD